MGGARVFKRTLRKLAEMILLRPVYLTSYIDVFVGFNFYQYSVFIRLAHVACFIGCMVTFEMTVNVVVLRAAHPCFTLIN